MRRNRVVRMALLSVTPIATLALLLGLSGKAPGLQKGPPPPLDHWAKATEDDYVGEKRCAPCHPVFADSFEVSAHASFVRNEHLPKDKQGCEACHGPGKIHIENRNVKATELSKFVVIFNKLKPEEASAVCLRCHATTMNPSHWRGTAHARAGVGCTTCHRIHPQEPPNRQVPPLAAAQSEKRPTHNDINLAQAKSLTPTIFPAHPDAKLMLRSDEATLCGSCHHREVNEFRQNFHHPIPEGRMICSDCHNAHPTRAAERKVELGKKACVTCHPETAGPFVYEHDPVSGNSGEGCMECHRPHGSPNPRLLSTFSRGVCAQCHSDKTVTHFPGRTCWQAGCHVGVHGSNTHPRLLAR